MIQCSNKVKIEMKNKIVKNKIVKNKAWSKTFGIVRNPKIEDQVKVNFIEK